MLRPHPTRVGNGQKELSAFATPFELSTAEDVLAAQKLTSRFGKNQTRDVHERSLTEDKEEKQVSGKVQTKRNVLIVLCYAYVSYIWRRRRF